MATHVEGGATFVRQYVAERSWTRFLFLVLAVSSLVVLLGLLVAPDRTWPSILLVGVYAVGLALSGMLFLAFHYLTSAGWSVSLKRIAEAMAATLPVGGLLILAAMGGISVLYEWSHADVVAASPLLQEKAVWLNVPFFVGRTVLYLAVWMLFIQGLLRVSRRQDSTGGLAGNRRSTALAAGFMAVFMVTFSLATFDWLMSLQPEWISTIYAAYNFTGSFISGLALLTITAIMLRRRGFLAGVVTQHHLHDLGKLILGFCTFWAYLWFCQYMLIWYSNLPEEVTYYQSRHQGAWAVISAACLLANWVIPFLVLLPRPAKHDDASLLRICALLLVGRWLNLYLMIQPVFQPDAPVLGLWEIAPVVAAAALFTLSFRRSLAAADLVPRGDPYLRESLEHHQ